MKKYNKKQRLLLKLLNKQLGYDYYFELEEYFHNVVCDD